MTTIIPAIRLPRCFHPDKIMNAPELLDLKVVEYFTFLQAEELPPTPPGLAMALGFSGFSALLKTLQTEEQNPGTYPQDAIYALQRACSYIEDWYVTHGLQEHIPVAFVRFLLSAYHNRSEKTVQEQMGRRDDQLQISILGLSEAMPPTHATLQANPQSINLPPSQASEEPLTIVYADTPTPNTPTPDTADDLADL